MKPSPGTVAAAVVACGLATGCASLPGAAAPQASVPDTSGLTLQLSCQLGFVGSDNDYNTVPGTFTTVETAEDQQLGYSPAIKVTATNDNSVLVSASAVDVSLYDANGDLLGSTSVDLGVEGIAPGVTITNVGVNITTSDAASCKTTSYEQG